MAEHTKVVKGSAGLAEVVVAIRNAGHGLEDIGVLPVVPARLTQHGAGLAVGVRRAYAFGQNPS